MGGTREFLYGCILLRNRHLPLLSYALMTEAGAGAHSCVGHLLRTVKGFKAYDWEDRPIGTYPTPDLAVAALMERATVEAAL